MRSTKTDPPRLSLPKLFLRQITAGRSPGAPGLGQVVGRLQARHLRPVPHRLFAFEQASAQARGLGDAQRRPTLQRLMHLPSPGLDPCRKLSAADFLVAKVPPGLKDFFADFQPGLADRFAGPASLQASYKVPLEVRPAQAAL